MDRDTFAPRYRAIEQALRERIAVLRPGDRLPSDSDLCAEFGVSRMTARNAMARLAEEGLVVRDPGRGSFVAEPPSHRRADSLMSFSREMRRQGRAPSSRLIACTVRDVTTREAIDLRLATGEAVVSVKRIRLADGQPIAIEHAVLDGRTAGAVMAADLSTGSLHETLMSAGFIPTKGQATLWAEAASAEDAALLEVRPGDPLLVERRVILDQRGRPLERTESRYAADRYALDVGFSVEDRGARPRAKGTTP
ncbi:MAG: GntR family transcriptional regulator [Chloroflexota bacterium]